ncbi:MAG TPA: hypothetical protein PLO62_05590 [Candidatus Hydrogenedentes bacterium]|nr:hypothetical protein [Candidatus Hydrogenedentota bacterium]
MWRQGASGACHASPPPPPTAPEIAQQIRSQVDPLVAQAPSPAARTQLLNVLQAAKATHSVTDNGKQALSTIKSELEDRVKQSFEDKRWAVCMVLCDAVDVMDPGNQRVARYKERATIEFNKPQVKLQGFVTDEETKAVYAYLEIFLPETNKTERKQVQENEEFLGLRFVEIIGDLRGIKLEYKKTGEIFDVMK